MEGTSSPVSVENTVYKNTSSTHSKSKALIILVVIIIFLVAVFIVILIGFLFGRNPITTTLDGSQTLTITPSIILTDNIEGSITASFPTGWSLKTYMDGEQSSKMPDPVIEYKGLGALEIKNAQNKVVFSMTMIYGIGGMATCPVIPQFSDTDPAYIQSIININNETLENPYSYKTIDLTNTSVKDYNLFGLPIRYAGNQLYISINPNTAFSGFNAECSELKNVAQVRSFTSTLPLKIYWTISELGYSENDFYVQYEFESNAATEDMVGLDQVLSTLRAN
jgi:hypothetical protein